MTEAEWLAKQQNPETILNFLRGKGPSDRKLRLFAVACCRRVWNLLTPQQQGQVGAAEQFADGRIDKKQLKDSRGPIPARFPDPAHEATQVGSWTAARQGAHHAKIAAGAAAWHARQRQGASETRILARARDEAWAVERKAQSAILRDLSAHLVRPVAVDRRWLTWNGGTIPTLAQAIYDDRAFDRLPILADALEEAGCADVDLLAHCRSGGEHARGCWVVDLLLGKE
jgi:hypothetical protein